MKISIGDAMPRSSNLLYRGASSASTIVMVFGFLALTLTGLGVWMWVDMSKHELDKRAEEYMAKKRGYSYAPLPDHAEPVPVPGPVNPPLAAPGLESNVFEC